MSTQAPILSGARVSKVFGSGETEVTALSDADLSIYPGEILLIEGPSGSGKTTLISILGLLMKPTSGRVFIHGQDVTAMPERGLAALRASALGFIFQGFNLFPALTALENVSLAIKMKNPRAKGPDQEARRLLVSVGLETRMHHLPANLSGGQKQRVAIARALVGNPEIVFADEPTAALDRDSALNVVHLLKRLGRERGTTTLMVTHDTKIIDLADRIVSLEDGRIVRDERVG